MSWTDFWLLWRRRPRPAESNIDDELMFHFRALVDEHLSQGMSADAAWRAAQDRFGSLKRYSEECHRVVSGADPMLQSVSTAGLVVLTLLVAWLFVEVRSLRQAHAAPPAAAQKETTRQPASGKKSASTQNDLAGTITDRHGKPLADVHVLVILKTWPNNRYRQEDFAGKTDKQGRFRFAKLVPAAGQRAIQLAAVRDGYALTSLYELKKDGEALESDAFKLTLDEAVPLTVTVRDAQGKAAAKARVIPFSRQTTDGQQHVVYFQAAKPIEVVADEEGRVRVHVFRRGDKAGLYVQLPGKDWEQLPFTVPEAGETVEITTNERL